MAISDVAAFGGSRTFRILRRLLPAHRVPAPSPCGANQGGAAHGTQEDAQTVSSVMSACSNYFLPIVFGLVGTMAALVRGIQDKVKDSTLTPRDEALTLIRLPLGMVAGVSVGLFLTPASVAAGNAGGFADFTLSASGIAFLAGYAAEAFFRSLDGLITHLFSVDRAPALGK